MTSWPAWRERARFLAVGDDEVAAYDLGEGTALTFCHGYPSASVDVAPVLDQLGEGFRLLAVDFPGFGASAKPPGRVHTIHAAADAVGVLWSDRQVERTLLVAHDYGVSVAQELLARRAEGRLGVEVTGVVWMNGGVYPDLHRPTVGQQVLLDPEQGAGLAAGMTEELFLGGIEGTWGTRVPMAPSLVGPIWESMHDGGGEHLMHELLHYIADRREHGDRWRGALERDDLPTWFVWGDLDPVSGAHMVERIEQRRPDATIVRLPDVGHWPTLEAPDEVARAVRALAAG